MVRRDAVILLARAEPSATGVRTHLLGVALLAGAEEAVGPEAPLAGPRPVSRRGVLPPLSAGPVTRPEILTLLEALGRGDLTAEVA
ncbi:MAG: ABC transporter permease, partial [Pseudomonadota bacterium]